MTERGDVFQGDVMIVGAGPAGIAAAATLASAGLSLLWIDQRDRAGGAIHRQPARAAVDGIHQPASVAAQWRRLSAAVATVPLAGGRVLLGVDAEGAVLVENRTLGRVEAHRPRAVILAVGAVERVLPRTGWHLPGVVTAGGMQVLLKETGTPPAGRILIAGGGPLNVALAAQLVRAGNPPLAVVEAGDPFRHPVAGLGLMRAPRLFAEAAGHLAVLRRAGVPWRRGARVVAIRPRDGALAVDCRRADGTLQTIEADHVALHDGIRPNEFGLPEQAPAAPLIVRAGDCREALGARAAEADGHAAARRVIAALEAGATPPADPAIASERRAQQTLARLFAPVDPDWAAALHDDTVLCRCEGRTVGDLRALIEADATLTPREVKLNGRFGMGACQGRFCADAVTALMARASSPPAAAQALTGRRWPLRPVSIAALIDHDTPPQP